MEIWLFWNLISSSFTYQVAFNSSAYQVERSYPVHRIKSGFTPSNPPPPGDTPAQQNAPGYSLLSVTTGYLGQFKSGFTPYYTELPGKKYGALPDERSALISTLFISPGEDAPQHKQGRSKIILISHSQFINSSLGPEQ